MENKMFCYQCEQTAGYPVQSLPQTIPVRGHHTQIFRLSVVPFVFSIYHPYPVSYSIYEFYIESLTTICYYELYTTKVCCAT